jgi:ABC-2 type transport system permease protein
MQLLSDILLVFRRYLAISLRHPTWIVLGLSQPIAFLVLYGPIMTRTLTSTGMESRLAWQTYVPGVLVQLSLFGAAFVGFTVITEWRAGVIERMRVTPVSRVALLVGRILRDVVLLLVQASLLLVAAVPFGLRTSPLGALIALGFVALMGSAVASLSSALALTLKSEDALGSMLNTWLMPMLLLSGVMLPMSFAPGWLDLVSRFTPFRYIVEAIRHVFAGDLTALAVPFGAALALALSFAAMAFGALTYRRQSA